LSWYYICKRIKYGSVELYNMVGHMLFDFMETIALLMVFYTRARESRTFQEN
jgi:hypothetical protein